MCTESWRVLTSNTLRSRAAWKRWRRMTGAITRRRRLQALSRRGRNETGARRQRRAGLGPRASAADTEPGEGQEPNGRHTWRTSATCPASAGERRTLPGSAAAAPPPRPRATSTLRSNVAAAAPPAGRHFRVRRLATPTPPAGTSGSRRSLLPPSGTALPGAVPPPPRPVELEVGVGRDLGGGAQGRAAAAWPWIKGEGQLGVSVREEPRRPRRRHVALL